MLPDPPWPRVDPARLRQARLSAHWAAQILAAAAEAELPAAPDDSHTSLQWVAEREAFATRPLPGGRHLELRIPALALRLDAEEYLLPGRTLQAALQWLGARLGGAAPALPKQDLPEHPAGRGAPFEADGEALAELARWYGFAAGLLGGLQGPLRCWPHHFDLAVLQELGPGRSLGAGLSPGDSGCEEPYLYVTPWPYPGQVELPELDGGGSWHREGWIGAMLPASRLADAAQARVFLDSALAACRALRPEA